MFKYNEQTFVNLKLKMLDLYRTIKADKEIKADAKNVLNVTLANTLSPERTKLDASDNVKEIYVIDIVLNSTNMPTKFIDALNKFINFQILFRLHYNYKIKYAISLKVFQDEKIKVLKNFESDWIKDDKQEMPITTKLENVFKLMVTNVAGYAFRKEESFQEFAQRVTLINNLHNKIEKQTKLMNSEKQPNKKIELNDTIRQMKKDLQRLESQLLEFSE